MLVLAMQFSRSVGVGPSAQHPGHEDAGAATRWPCRRRLEEMAGATPSKQKTGQCVEPELDRWEGRTLTTSDVAWTRSSEAPTGSRSCVVQEH